MVEKIRESEQSKIEQAELKQMQIKHIYPSGLERNYKKFVDKELVQTLLNISAEKSLAKLKLEQAEIIVTEIRARINNLKNELLLKTDFKKEGCTNDKQRTAFINRNESVKKLEETLKSNEKNVRLLRNKYENLQEEHSNYRLFIRLEISNRKDKTQVIVNEAYLDEIIDSVIESVNDKKEMV